VRTQVVHLALAETALSPRELACRFNDDNRYFVSESSVYRILKAHDLITSPAYVLLSASDAFKDPPRRVHELWQTDFTYFRIIGWGWYYLSTILDDFSRYIVAWLLSPTMGAGDVTATLVPGDLERAIADFVAYYNHERYHESLNNVTPADVYFGRHRDVLTARDQIKIQTLNQRRRDSRAACAA